MKKAFKSFLSLVLCLLLVMSVPAVSFAENEDFSVSRLSVCVNGDADSSRGF